jgi:DNA-binding NtrC family response regulator
MIAAFAILLRLFWRRRISRWSKQHADEVALIFADVHIPCLLDGVDLARAVHTRWPWIKVVVTSGAPGDRLAHLPSSATFLPKPWCALDVLVAAEQACEQAATQ